MVKPAPEELKEYAGSYANDELACASAWTPLATG